MIPNVTISDVRGQAMLNDLREALIGSGQIGDAATVLADEFRLLLKQIITLTPPHGLGQAAKQAGEGAVSKDLKKLFTPVDEDMLNTIGSKFGVDGIDEWITGASGDKLHLIWDKLDPTGQGIEKFHQDHRNARGRVTGGRKEIEGAWHAIYVVTTTDFLAYLKKVLARVGMRKSGWAKAYISIGGTVQRWIAAHVASGNCPGEVINNLGDKRNPNISAFNSAPGIRDDERIVRDALRVRREAMTKRLKLILSGYSKDVAQKIRPRKHAVKVPMSAEATFESATGVAFSSLGQ